MRQIEREELSPWHAAFADAAGDDAILHPVNASARVRWNAAFAYLDPARSRENLTILADTLVDRVLLEGDRAVGLATSAGELRAGTVVLAAGAYGSPGILLRSGIGAELPVGEGLIDHVGVGFRFEGTERLLDEAAAFERARPLFMAQVTVASRAAPASPGCGTSSTSPRSSAAPSGYEVSVAVFAMKPRSRGAVRLDSPDPRAPLAIDHGFLADPRDAAVLAEGVERLPGAGRRRRRRRLRRGASSSPGATWARASTWRRTCAASSIRSARARSAAWSTATAACSGVDGLVVADASVMPTIPRVNTNLSTLALAERIAERI